MNQNTLRAGLMFAMLLTGGHLLAPAPTVAQDGCVAGKCHATLLTNATVHPIAESCETCHAAVETPHPKKGAKTFKLTQDPPDLCYTCHEAFGTKAQVHFPVTAGMCTTCHDPHSSNQPKLLVRPQEDVCFQCHGDIDEIVTKAAVAHPGMAVGCAGCHTPHASDHEKLLLHDVKETCLDCHTDVVTQNMTVFHGPNNDGKCTRCHTPHGGQHEKLLANEFPSLGYVSYTDTAYPLCFGCHKRDLLQDPETSAATNFRDGERNLHFVHVNKEKGRSCKLCHNWHGSASPELIADVVPFGQWNLPLRFVKTETGGGCSPGCHKPLYYDRKSPGRKPAATPPKTSD